MERWRDVCTNLYYFTNFISYFYTQLLLLLQLLLATFTNFYWLLLLATFTTTFTTFNRVVWIKENKMTCHIEREINAMSVSLISLQVGGARSSGYGSRPHRSVGGAGGMVMSTAPAAANSVYYHYVPVPNAPLYYSTQPQQYPTAPVSW